MVFADDLKPCPECKGIDIRYSTRIGCTVSTDKHYYYCKKCGYKTAIRSTVKLADKAWNERLI